MNADPKLTHVAVQWQHASPLIACRFDPKGRYAFASAEDCSVLRWELSSGKKAAFETHDSWVLDLAFLSGGETLVTVGCDDQMIWWPVAADKPTPARKIVAHRGWIRAVAVNPDGKLLATGGNDHLVKLWNAADGSAVRELAGHGSDVYSVRFHPSGQFLLSGDLAGEVRQWETATGKLLRTFDAKALHTYDGGQQVHYGGVRSIAFSPDAKFMACSGLHKATNPLGAVNEPLVLVFEWESQKLLRSHVTSNSFKGIGFRAVYLADGTLACAAGGSGGGAVVFWKPGEDKEFTQFKLPNTARDLDLHPDGLQLCTTHHDRHLRISRMMQPPAKPT
jgi:WD40 repeat protein